MPTTNPVPSTDPTDLLFNAQKLDEVVSGSAQYYTDRLGVNRRTMEGISAAADAVLGGLGYAPPVTYASGISMTLTTQTVEYSGEIYAPKVASLPFTTSAWATDSARFRLIQGVSATDLAASGGSSMIGYMPAGTGAVATTVQSKLRESVSVKDFGAVGDGVTDDTAAIQAAIDTGKSLFFPQGVYLCDSLKYYWGDAGSDATRIYYGAGAVIKGSSSTPKDYLLDVAGQNLRIYGLELQGKGALDTTYGALLRVHTRSNAVNLDDIHFESMVFRFNHIDVIYGLATDTTAKVSEVFFRGCTFTQSQKIFDIQGPNYVDLFVSDCYMAQAALSVSNNNENYIVKIPNGTVSFNNCHIMATGLNGNVSVGWIGYFPENASNASLTITGGILEAKEGFHWGSDSSAVLRISNIANGYWGWEYNGDALFQIGSNVSGGVYLTNTHFIHSYGHGPLLIDASTSPNFEIRTDDGCSFSSVLATDVDIFTKIIGGKWNFPETEIVLCYGRTSNPITAPNIGSVKYATDWITASHAVHRFKNLQSDGVITVPAEGLKNAWVEILVDWDQVSSTGYITRHTALSCAAINNDTYVVIVTAQDVGGNLFERGIVPGARVFDETGTYVNTVSTVDFNNGFFRLASNYTGATGTKTFTFEMEIATITKNTLQRIYVGDLWPADKLRLTLKANSATTDTTLSYQRLRVVAGSRIVSYEWNKFV